MIILVLWLVFWGFSFRYCRKVATQLNYRGDVALLAAFIAPILAPIIYAIISWRKSSKGSFVQNMSEDRAD